MPVKFVTTYIFIHRFLSETCPAAHDDSVSHGLEDLADLVLDMATVIVERSGVLPAILPQVSPYWAVVSPLGLSLVNIPQAGPAHIAAISPELQQKTYAALLQVFWVYMFEVRL